MILSNEVPLKKEQGIATLTLTSLMETDLVDIILRHLSTASLTRPQYNHLLRKHAEEMIEDMLQEIQNKNM